jgi:hypothetical protein
MDVSKKENITELRDASHYAPWIKLIPLDRTVPFTEYEFANQFIKVADIVLDLEVNATGDRRRQTVIRFVPVIPGQQYREKWEWVYILLIDGKIVKIGGTRTGLSGRAGSYLCGHYIPQRGGGHKMSTTNAFIYNTFEFYLQQGCNVEMYGYRIPRAEMVLDNVFGRQIRDVAQVFHIYESVALNNFRVKYGFNPFLSDNSDPMYRDA